MRNLVISEYDDSLSSLSEMFMCELWWQDFDYEDKTPEQIQTQTDMIVYHTYTTILSIYEFNHLR